MATYPAQGQSADNGGTWDEQLKQYIDETAGSGVPGDPGEGLPPGGDTGQIAKKASDADFDVEWADEAAGGVTTVNGEDGDVVLTASDVGADAAGTAAGLVTTEATTRAAADSTNATAIAAEATARASADTTNANAISTETTRATAAEGTNATAITTEASTRATADTTNATAITAETSRATTAEALKAPIASPTFTGTVTLPADGTTGLQPVTWQQWQAALTAQDAKDPVAYASTSALPANTYANGTAGVGATLTGNSNGPLIVDGVTILVGQVGERVLVAGESAASHNGIYTITQQGVVAVSPYVLTRAVDFDQPAEVDAGDLVPVSAPTGFTAGSVNNGKVFLTVVPSPVVFGTSAIAFSSVGGTYSAGTGLSLSGSTFSIDTGVTVDKTTAQTLTNKTLTAPAISSPTGITAADVSASPALPDFGSVITAAGPTTMAVNKTYRVDSTSNAVAMALPTSQPVGSSILLKVVAPNPLVNLVTWATTGSDVINRTGGATTDTLKVVGAWAIFTYLGSNIWLKREGEPLAQLDARYVNDSLFTTKGDQVAATASATPARVAVGTDGQYWKADSSQPTGLGWGGSPTQAMIGGLRFITHSYGSFNGVSSPVGNFNNYIHRILATVGIPVNETDFWFHAGMQASSPNIGDAGSIAQQGSGGFFRQAYPTHLYGTAVNSGTIPTATSKAAPGTTLMNLGVNDVEALRYDSNALAAAQQAMRAILAYDRLRTLFQADNAALVYNGTWAGTQTDKNYAITAKYNSSTTLNDYVEFTIPTTFRGGYVDLFLLGNPGGMTTLSAAMTDTTGTTAAMTTRQPFPSSSQQFVILVDSEQMLVTAGWGTTAGNFTVTRGYNGTTAATHLINAVVTRPKTTTYLDFSGSTATEAAAQVSVGAQDGTGKLFISGQGCGGSTFGIVQSPDVHMVQRFLLTAASAGLKIRAQLKNGGTQTGSVPGEWLRPMAFGVEDDDARVQFLVNQPLYARPSANVTAVDPTTYASRLATLNANHATLISEFASSYLVDVAAYYSAQFGATIQTDPGSGGTTVHITPNDATQNILTQGSVLIVEAEVLLVTSAITKTSSTDWSFTATRQFGFGGTGGGSGIFGSAAAAAHAIGAAVIDVKPWSFVDGIHPSDYGHEVYADRCINTILAVPWNTRKLAGTGGYVAHDDQQWPAPASGVAYPIYRTVQGAARSTLAVTQSLEYADPFWIPRSGVLTYFGVWSTAGAASSVARFGFYTDVGYPGSLIIDLGTLATPATTGTGLITQACLIPVKRGWYWRTYVAQGGAPTVASTPTHSPPLGYQIPDPSSNLNGNAPIGLSRASMTGALTTWDAALTAPVNATAKFPLIVVGFEPFITA